jgi:hypothetical protein
VRTPERLAASINKSVTSDMFLEQQRPSKQGRCTNNNKNRKKDMDHVDTTPAAEASIHERIIRGTQATKSTSFHTKLLSKPAAQAGSGQLHVAKASRDRWQAVFGKVAPLSRVTSP